MRHDLPMRHIADFVPSPRFSGLSRPSRSQRRPSRTGRTAAAVAPATLAAILAFTAACSSDAVDSAGSGDVQETSANGEMGSIDGGSLSTAGPNAGSIGSGNSGSADGLGSSGAAQPDTTGEVEVVRELGHDSAAFTQGLEMREGELYESTGDYGTSWVSARPLDSGPTDYRVKTDPLPGREFGEGMTITGNTLWQLTWKDGIAYKRDATTLEETGRAEYDGEGWGLCTLGDQLVMSDGSNKLTLRDPETFEPTGEINVTLKAKGVDNLNELDCSDGRIYANVWMTDKIVRIDPSSGEVDAQWDLGQLQQPRPSDPDAVLNGIAKVPGSDTFLVTGKMWPNMYEVRLK